MAAPFDMFSPNASPEDIQRAQAQLMQQEQAQQQALSSQSKFGLLMTLAGKDLTPAGQALMQGAQQGQAGMSRYDAQMIKSMLMGRGLTEKERHDQATENAPKLMTFGSDAQGRDLVDKNGKVVATKEPVVKTPSAKGGARQEKANSHLYFGPDWEPSADFKAKVEAGEADPDSPVIKQVMTEGKTLDSAAGEFGDVAVRMRNFLKKHPNGVTSGSDATEADGLAVDLRALYMKNLNMKTLREFDVPLLNRAVADPTALGNILKSGVGALDFQRQLDTAASLAKQRVYSHLHGLFQPVGTAEGKPRGRYAGFKSIEEPGAGGTDVGGAAPAMVNVREKSSKKVKPMPADKAALILKDPNYEVVPQ